MKTACAILVIVLLIVFGVATIWSTVSMAQESTPNYCVKVQRKGNRLLLKWNALTGMQPSEADHVLRIEVATDGDVRAITVPKGNGSTKLANFKRGGDVAVSLALLYEEAPFTATETFVLSHYRTRAQSLLCPVLVKERDDAIATATPVAPKATALFTPVPVEFRHNC